MSKKSLKILSLIAVVVIFFALFLALTGIVGGRSILGKVKSVEATVVDIYEGPSYDIVFDMSDSRSYYINRGTKQGLNIDSMRYYYLNQKLELSYVSLFGSKGGHISRIKLGDSVVYNELK